MNARYNHRAGLLALAVLICLPFAGSGSARAGEVHTGAWGLISTMGSQNPLDDAIRLVTGDPADPFVHNNLIYVDMDMQYNYPSYQVWESATWRPSSTFPTQRFPASLLGTDFGPPIEGRYIQLRNLTLERADLDAQNVEFRFVPIPAGPGTTTSLTLNNGSLTALNPPRFNDAANFALTASGDSRLSGWDKGQVSAQTALNVMPGGQLTLFRLGDRHGDLPTDSWYFSHPGDVATIDGGTLHLDESFVVFEKQGLAPGESHSRMTFQNNALLTITGDRGRLQSGDFAFLDSRLNLGSANRLKSVGTMTINGATVTGDDYSKLDAEALMVFGSNTFALGKDRGAGDYLATTGGIDMKPGASLTLNGQGSLAVTFGLYYSFPASGQIVINDRATLVNSGAHFIIRPSAPITLNRTSDNVYGFLDVKDGGSLDLMAGGADTGHVTNHGGIGVSRDGTLLALGPLLIQGGSEGIIDIDSGGVLAIGNQGTQQAAIDSLTTNNTVTLINFSALQLTLDLAALKNGQLRLGSTLHIEPFADLHLTLVNDQVLPDGTKFTLIDYGVLGAGSHFNGYPEGHIFGLGSNSFRIHYADNADDPGYAHAITLTVVDHPALSPAVQQVAGVVNSPLTPTSALTPLNFEPGCVLTFTSPSLPAGGLSLDPNTGVISGTPIAAQAAANITITGTTPIGGLCTGQSAQATVTLTVAATQIITFAAPPTPTFTPNGTFVVSATATSGGVVVYSSQTPAVCTTNGGSTITMLGAGTCTIAANQPGNANWAPAPQVTQDITITPGTQAALVLIASPASIAVNGTSQLQATGGSGTGAVTYYRISGPCSLGGATLTGTSTGNCVFSATKAADPNYKPSTSNDVTVVVTALPLTVSYPANPLTIGTPAYLSPTVSGATGPVTYLLLFGPLPPGLIFDPATGVIRGTPTGPAGQYPVAIKVTSGAAIFVASLTLTVQAPVQPIPTLSEWGMLILASLMVLAAGWRGRRFGLR